MKVTDTRKLSPQSQEVVRRRVVRAVVDGGLGHAAAARTFSVSRTSVVAWVRAYRDGGHAALRSGKRGRKPAPRLKPHQAAPAVRLIADRCPDQLKLPWALWTREAVCRLLEGRFGLRVSVWTAGRYLRRWGLTPQKPLRRAYERDPAAVRRWLREEYPAIARRAKARNALIHWGDEMGLRSDHRAGTSWGRRGRTPVVGGTGKRFRCNVASAITNRGRLSFMVFKGRFTSGVFIGFLRRLLRQPHLGGRRCFLVLDGHPVHKSAATRSWVDQQGGRLELFFLPGYSPELNPDELLNQDVKTNALGRERPRDQARRMHLARTYLWGTQRRPDIVRDYFLQEHVRYAADEEVFNHYRSP